MESDLSHRLLEQAIEMLRAIRSDQIQLRQDQESQRALHASTCREIHELKEELRAYTQKTVAVGGPNQHLQHLFPSPIAGLFSPAVPPPGHRREGDGEKDLLCQIRRRKSDQAVDGGGGGMALSLQADLVTVKLANEGGSGRGGGEATGSRKMNETPLPLPVEFGFDPDGADLTPWDEEPGGQSEVNAGGKKEVKPGPRVPNDLQISLVGGAPIIQVKPKVKSLEHKVIKTTFLHVNRPRV